MNNGGHIRGHHFVAGETMPLHHRVGEAGDRILFRAGGQDALGESQCQWHAVLLISVLVKLKITFVIYTLDCDRYLVNCNIYREYLKRGRHEA